MYTREMKLIKERLTENEFYEYLEDVKTNMESTTTYWRQNDEVVPFSDDLRKKYIYGEEENEEIAIYFTTELDEEHDQIFYNIWEY